MTDEYVRKADAKDALQEKVFHNLTDEFYGAMQAIDELPSADVAPVVRCKDCAWCEYDTALDQYWCTRGRLIIGWHVMPDDFCSYAERREE